jgi:hypothetical protein
MSGSDWSAGILACNAAASAVSKDGGQVCVGNLECNNPKGQKRLNTMYERKPLRFEMFGV